MADSASKSGIDQLGTKAADALIIVASESFRLDNRAYVSKADGHQKPKSTASDSSPCATASLTCEHCRNL